jgi:hypothetical protein
MTCADVRDRLAEFALGVLSPDETAAIERHVEWCAGCRKEVHEMQEGLAGVALGLSQVEPHRALEERVVERVARAAGRRPAPSHRRGRVLIATTMAAVLAAFGAVGWAMAERQRADDIQAIRDRQREVIFGLQDLIEGLGGRPFAAELVPTRGGLGAGSAVIFHADNDADWALVEVALPDYRATPYTVRLLDDRGRTRLSGQLVESNNNTLILYQQTGRELVDIVSVAITNRSGVKLLTGDVQPYPSSSAG